MSVYVSRQVPGQHERGRMNKLVFGLAAFQLVAGAASAAEPLSDGQLDRITAGALPPIMIDCPGCVSTSSGQTSTTTNGTTAVVTSTGNTGGSGSSGVSGSTGNTGGSGGVSGSTGNTGVSGGVSGSTGNTGVSGGVSGGTENTGIKQTLSADIGFWSDQTILALVGGKPEFVWPVKPLITLGVGP